MLVKIEARILIFPGTDFHFPSTSVPPGTFLRLCLLLHENKEFYAVIEAGGDAAQVGFPRAFRQQHDTHRSTRKIGRRHHAKKPMRYIPISRISLCRPKHAGLFQQLDLLTVTLTHQETGNKVT